MDNKTVTSAQYVDSNNNTIKAVIDGQELFVPLNPDNTDYQAIQEWASQEGNTIADAD